MEEEKKPVNPTPEPNSSKSKGNGGLIAGIIIIVLLLAIIGILSLVLIMININKSEPKEPEQQIVTTINEVKQDEDKEEEKRKVVETVEANGISYLSDYSAFDLGVEDIVDMLESDIEDPDQQLIAKNNKYEIELERDIICRVEVDDDGYVKKVTLLSTIPKADIEEEDNPAYYIGAYFGTILNELDLDDREIVQSGIHYISDTGDAVTYDNYETVKHLKMRLMEKNNGDSTTMIFEMSPDKNESGKDKKLNN